MFGKKTSEEANSGNVLAPPSLLPSSSLPPEGIKSASITTEPLEQAAVAQAAAVSMAYYRDSKLETHDYRHAKRALLMELLDQVDFQSLEHLKLEQKTLRVKEACDIILPKIQVPLTAAQITLIKQQASDEILG